MKLDFHDYLNNEDDWTGKTPLPSLLPRFVVALRLSDLSRQTDCGEELEAERVSTRVRTVSFEGKWRMQCRSFFVFNPFWLLDALFFLALHTFLVVL
jgi:hypothetical protein